MFEKGLLGNTARDNYLQYQIDLLKKQKNNLQSKIVTIKSTDWTGNLFDINLGSIVPSENDILAICPSDDTSEVYFDSDISSIIIENILRLTCSDIPESDIVITIIYGKAEAF